MAKKSAKKSASKKAATKKAAKRKAPAFSARSAKSLLGASLSQLLGKDATGAFVTIERAESSCLPGELAGRFILEGAFRSKKKGTK